MLHVGHCDVVPGHGLSRVGLAEMPGRNVMPCYPRESGKRPSDGVTGSYLTKGRLLLAHEGDHFAFGLPRFLRIAPPHLDAMGVVHDPVEGAIGQRGIAYLFVPPRDRQLRGEDG